MNTHRLDFKIQGMTCASCVARVERAVAWVPGVEKVTVNLANETMYVQAEKEVSMDAVMDAVKKAGYQASYKDDSEETVRFKVKGMTCSACSARVEKILKKQEGVLDASVNLAGETALVRTGPDASV
ncbi:MAG: copper ion binding protein, partial [Desulfonatronovibrio sp.]